MKKLLFAMTLLFCAAMGQSQTFELEKAEPKVVLEFREIVPDTLTGSILYDGKLIEGKVVRHRYKCTFDYNEKHEGEIFHTLPTDYFDMENKALDAKKVLGWNLPGNSLAYIGNRWNGWGLNSTYTTFDSSVLCSTAVNANDITPSINEVGVDDFLPNSKEIIITGQ